MLFHYISGYVNAPKCHACLKFFSAFTFSFENSASWCTLTITYPIVMQKKNTRILQNTAPSPTILHSTQTSNVNTKHSALCCITLHSPSSNNQVLTPVTNERYVLSQRTIVCRCVHQNPTQFTQRQTNHPPNHDNTKHYPQAELLLLPGPNIPTR